MSYLMEPCLSFFGRFLSDVSTRNNSAANYPPGGVPVDQWNALGGATFELLGCRAAPRSGLPPGDPAAGYAVTGALDRPGAKMVDLDPDWQAASEIWGLSLRVLDPGTGALGVEGRFEVAAFRDLWTRQTDASANGQAAGARYVSVLSDLAWGPAAEASPQLSRLREETQGGRLSVGMHQFGYYYTQDSPRHRTGALAVHLGPYRAGEPDTVLVHRRIGGVTIAGPGGRPLDLIGDIDFALSEDGAQGHFDLGHALRIADPDGTLADLRALHPGLAGLATVAVGLLPEPAPPLFSDLPEAQVETLLELPSEPGWYRETGGVVTVALPAALGPRAAARRLALIGRFADGRNLLLAQETEGGVFFRADGFVRRLEAGESARVRLHARRFGRPLAGLAIRTVRLWPDPAAPGLAVSGVAVTDGQGVAELALDAADPGRPRAQADMDGQVFGIAYAAEIAVDGRPVLEGTGLGGLDLIVAHVRDPFPVPEEPEFHAHIEGFMTQYARLYPIMSEHLFDIGSYEALARNRRAMLLALGRPIQDPNHMPVTRDLSAGKRATLVRWLSQETGDPEAPLRRDPARAAPEAAALAPGSERRAEGGDAKSQAAAPLPRVPHRPVLRLDAPEA